MGKIVDSLSSLSGILLLKTIAFVTPIPYPRTYSITLPQTALGPAPDGHLRPYSRRSHLQQHPVGLPTLPCLNPHTPGPVPLQASPQVSSLPLQVLLILPTLPMAQLLQQSPRNSYVNHRTSELQGASEIRLGNQATGRRNLPKVAQ